MTRLALLSCALLVACGGNPQSQDPVYDFAGIDLYGHEVNDAGMVVVADLAGVDLAGAPSGPQFQVVAPTVTSAHTSVAIDVKVTDESSTLTASNITCTVRKPGDTPLVATAITDGFEVKATVVFSGYNPVLDGSISIVISATDGAGVTATKDIVLTVDDAGPVISMVVPTQDSFIGGMTAVSATVVDTGSGVDPNKVFATFTANGKYQIPLINTQGDNYAGVFDASQLGKQFVLPSLTIQATDKLGNESDASFELRADNTQPIMALDPPLMRMSEVSTTLGNVCSKSFDPVGSDAVNDGYNSTQDAQLLSLRARIEDQANSTSGQTVHYISGIDAGTVKLIALPAPMGVDPTTGNVPIVAVDTDGDGVCDNINPAITAVKAGQPAQTAAQYLGIVMNPLLTGGAPNFEPSTGTTPPGCDALGDPNVTTAPPTLCDATPPDMTYSLTYTTGKIPSIWTIGTVGPDGIGQDECVGDQLDTLNLLPEGWACFAVVASDAKANHAISAPLRACIRRTSMPSHPCDTQPTPPNCTGTYTPATGKTTATACTPQTFVQTTEEVRGL